MWQEVHIGRALLHKHCKHPFACNTCSKIQIGKAPVHTHWRKVSCLHHMWQDIQNEKASVHTHWRTGVIFSCICTDDLWIWILFSSVYGQVLFQSNLLPHLVLAKGLLQCACTNALPIQTSCHIGGSQKVFLQCVWGYAFSLKSLNTCRMFFTSVYDLMLTTAYCG